MRSIRLASFALLVCVVGCRSTDAPAQAPGDAAPDAAAPAAAAAVPTVTEPVSSGSRWFHVSRGVTPVGVVEFPAAAPVRLVWTSAGEGAEKLATEVTLLSARGALFEKVHQDHPDGTEELVGVKRQPGSDGYIQLVRRAITALHMNVTEIGPMPDANPSANVRKLTIRYDNEPAGTIVFERTGPKFAAPPGAETHATRMLQHYWTQLQAMPSLHVCFATKKDDNTVLESHQASPDQPHFGALVRIWLLGDKDASGERHFQVVAEER